MALFKNIAIGYIITSYSRYAIYPSALFTIIAEGYMLYCYLLLSLLFILLFLGCFATSDMKQDMEIITNSYDNISYDKYNIISSAMAPALLGTAKDMQEHVKNGTFNDPDYQIEYQADLKQFNIPIEDALHIVSDDYDDEE